MFEYSECCNVVFKFNAIHCRVCSMNIKYNHSPGSLGELSGAFFKKWKF